MSLSDRGYTGKILRINLTERKYKTEELSEKIAELLLGGVGIGTHYLLREVPKRVDPLSEKNKLFFVTGPLTGTIAPCSSKVGVITKSPKTGGYLDSYASGFFGQTIKYAGYDMIILEGCSDKPVIILIDDDRIRFEDAGELWGGLVDEVTRRLKEKYGDGYRSVVIGPAGERKSPLAGIFTETRTFGRGGAGAVMGSKNVKAILIRGTGSIQVHDPEKFGEGVHTAYRELRRSSTVRRFKSKGTINMIEFVNALGGLPTRNFQSGQFEKAEKLYGEKWREEGLWISDAGCFNCPIYCSKISRIKEGPYKGTVTDGPDYETIYSFGPACGISDKSAIVYANYLCDIYGVDTISTGNIIAYTIELFKKGIISEKELDGIKLDWGNVQAVIALTEKICKGEGVGKLLEQGVKAISERYPEGKDFAMQVKGLEMPAYLPRAAKGVALAYAVTPRGACHLHGAPTVELLGGADAISYEGKPELVLLKQTDSIIIDSVILCYFVLMGLTLKEVFQMVKPCTGFRYDSPRAFDTIAQRIVTLQRVFNLREGFSKKDDTLPSRTLHEPLGTGPAKGEVVHLDSLRSQYYQLMGWDENGIPIKETLKRLEIDDLILRF